MEYKPTKYLKKDIKEAEKEFVEGNFQVAHSIEELEKQLRS